MILYELIGGSIKKDPTDIRGKANMFKYKGPKGVRIACILDDEEAAFGLKQQTDVAIVMPQYLGKLMSDGELVPNKLRVVVFDEADLALEETSPDDLQTLFDEGRKSSRLTFIVGASVTEALGNLAVKSRIIPNGKSYIASATRYYPLTSDVEKDGDGSDDAVNLQNTTGTLNRGTIAGDEPKTASLKDLDVCLDPGLIHQRVTVGKNESGLLVLTRMLRKELKAYENDQIGRPTSDQTPPRVVIFFPDEVIAKESIVPLRDALWGEHKVCVLLPKIGVNPLQMMEQFKNNETTVMLATPNSVRGLDFPAVTHVYTLYLPTDDPREYVHLAGRVGRVGQSGSVRGRGGRVVSVLKEEDASKMESLASELGFQFDDVKVESTVIPTLEMDDDGLLETDSVDVEEMRRYLEDTISLLSSNFDDGGDEIKSPSPPQTSSADTIDVDFDENTETDFQ
jgi:superfamily II DNA/RNA helicase